MVTAAAPKPSSPSGLLGLTVEGEGCPSNDSNQQPQAGEISGKLQQTPVAQWEKQQKPSTRETGGGVT